MKTFQADVLDACECNKSIPFFSNFDNQDIAGINNSSKTTEKIFAIKKICSVHIGASIEQSVMNKSISATQKNILLSLTKNSMSSQSSNLHVFNRGHPKKSKVNP